MGNETQITDNTSPRTKLSDRLETVFTTIGDNMGRQSLYLSEMSEGINIIAAQTKTDKDDEAIDKLKNKTNSNDPIHGGMFNVMTSAASGAFGASVIGGIMGGNLAAIGGMIGKSLLTVAFADDVGRFIGDTVGGALKGLDVSDEVRAKVTDSVSSNVETGLMVGLFNRKAGIFTAIAGMGLDAIEHFFGSKSFDFGFGEFKLSDPSVAATLGTVIAMLGPALIRIAGGAALAAIGTISLPALAIGAGVVAATAAGVYGVNYFNEKHEEWQKQRFESQLKEMQDYVSGNMNLNLQKAREEDQKGWFVSRDKNIMDDIERLNAEAYRLGARQTRAEHHAGFAKEDRVKLSTEETEGGYEYRVSSKPIDITHIDGLSDDARKNFNDQKAMVPSLLRGMDYNAMTEEELSKVASLASFYGVSDQLEIIKEKLQEFTNLNPDTSFALSPWRERNYDDKLTLNDIKKLHAKEVLGRMYTPETDNTRVKLSPKVRDEYDNFLKELMYSNSKNESTALTTMLSANDESVVDSMLFNQMTQEQRDAIFALRSKDSAASTLIAPVSNNTSVRHGDNISNVTIINNGLGASSALSSVPNIPQY